MTTPNRQSPQVKSNSQTEDTKGSWYRSPIVWLGIVITVVIFIGCVQFLMLAAVKKVLTTQPVKIHKQKLQRKRNSLIFWVFLLALPPLQNLKKTPRKQTEKTQTNHYETFPTLLSL